MTFVTLGFVLVAFSVYALLRWRGGLHQNPEPRIGPLD